jgi:hypothetical protein
MKDVAATAPEQHFALLRELYRASVGNISVGLGPSHLRDCARRASLSGADGDLAIEWLLGQGLVDRRDLRGGIYMSHAGVKEIEDSFARPEDGTAHFPATVTRATATR